MLSHKKVLFPFKLHHSKATIEKSTKNFDSGGYGLKSNIVEILLKTLLVLNLNSYYFLGKYC